MSDFLTFLKQRDARGAKGVSSAEMSASTSTEPTTAGTETGTTPARRRTLPWAEVSAPTTAPREMNATEAPGNPAKRFSVCRLKFTTYEMDTPIRVGGKCALADAAEAASSETFSENGQSEKTTSLASKLAAEMAAIAAADGAKIFYVGKPDVAIPADWDGTESPDAPTKISWENATASGEVLHKVVVADAGEHFVDFAIRTAPANTAAAVPAADSETDIAAAASALVFSGIVRFLDACKGGTPNFAIEPRGDSAAENSAENSAASWTMKTGGKFPRPASPPDGCNLYIDVDFTGESTKPGTWKSMWKEINISLASDSEVMAEDLQIIVESTQTQCNSLPPPPPDPDLAPAAVGRKVTTTPFVIVDLGDGSAPLQDALGLIPKPKVYGTFSTTLVKGEPIHIEFGLFDADNQNNENSVVHQFIGQLKITVKGEDLGALVYDESYNENTSSGGSSESTLRLAQPFCPTIYLESVTFGNGWDVKRDVNGFSYPEPHWKRDSLSTALQPCPYLYGGTKKKLFIKKVVFSYEGEIPGGDSIRIQAQEGNGYKIPMTSALLDREAKTITVENVEAVKDFPAQVRFFKEFTLKWEISLDGGASFFLVDESKNPIYVCLKCPEDNVPIPYRTVVHLACSKDGANTADDAVENTWTHFTDCDVKGWDEGTKGFNRKLYYYKPGTTFAANAVDSTGALLASDIHTGQCSTWASLLRDACLLNGAEVERVWALAFSMDGSCVYEHFLIKDWTYNPMKDPLMFTTISASEDMLPVPVRGVYGDFTNTSTLEGQNSMPPSQKLFNLHIFVRHRKSNAELQYLDPSYGVKYSDEFYFQTSAVEMVSVRGRLVSDFFIDTPPQVFSIELVPSEMYAQRFIFFPESTFSS